MTQESGNKAYTIHEDGSMTITLPAAIVTSLETIRQHMTGCEAESEVEQAVTGLLGVGELPNIKELLATVNSYENIIAGIIYAKAHEFMYLSRMAKRVKDARSNPAKSRLLDALLEED